MANNKSDLILIVDDNATYRKILVRILEHENFTTVECKNGYQGIEKAIELQPNLILLDIKMPDINGFETCIKIKENSAIAHIPIIFMTSLDDVEHKIKGLKIGGVDYITKPFQPEEVLYRVKIHLKLVNINKTLSHKNQELEAEIKARKKAEKQLLKLNKNLEETVNEKTKDLHKALSDLREREKQLAYKAYYDDLTKLPNRYWLNSYLEDLIQEAKKSSANNPCYHSILFIDLDRFKVINDSLGHLIGDQLLTLVAERLIDFSPENSVITRFGGDEFIILLQDDKCMENITNTVTLLLQELQQPFVVNNYKLFINASMGVAIHDYKKVDVIHILRDGDVALYQAKKNGRGTYVILDETIRNEALSRLELENDLRKALEEEKLDLYYQPIFCLKNNVLKGFEALIRWRHPQLGFISPSLFVSIAEEIGLINWLNDFVLSQACRRLGIWFSSFPSLTDIFVNVNLSIINLSQSNITEKLDSFLTQKLFPESCLKIEITEGCLEDATSSTFDILNSINDRGIKLCIDDFGTGYSSLSRLHALPIKTLKIDKSFVDKITPKSESQTIIKTILALAHSLGMEVVAEGVENEMQRDILTHLGCDFAQGYFYFPPLDVYKATDLIKEVN